MIQQQEKAIFIEYCNNCGSHAWCTKHDESRYLYFFETMKQELERQFEGITVYGNINPLSGKPIVPSLGAFEVFYMKCRVFSKLKTSTWPVASQITSRIKSVMEGKIPEGCETVEYTYDDAPAVERKRRVVHIPKQHKRTFDCQNGSAKNDSFACTLTSLPTECQAYQENGMPSWKGDVKSRPQTWIEMESKIRKRVAATIKPEEKLNKFSQTMYNKNKLSTPKTDKKANPKVNNENYYLPGKGRVGTSAVKGRDPTSLNEMSLTLQTVNDFTNVYPTYADSIVMKDMKDEFNAVKRKNNNRQLSVNTANTRTSLAYNKLEPLDRTAIANTGQTLDSKADVSFQRRHGRSLSQDMGKEVTEQEMNESTVFSQRCKEPTSVRNEVPRDTGIKKQRRQLQWFPDGLSDRSSPERFEEKILREKKGNNGNNGNQGHNDNDEEYEIDLMFPNSVKDPETKEEDAFLAKLKKLRFPEEKLSQIRIPRRTAAKKKITIMPDEEKDCRIEIHATHPQILGLATNQFSVAKGTAFKIPLKFDYQEIKFLDDFCLYILKDNRPWEKVIIDLHFL